MISDSTIMRKVPDAENGVPLTTVRVVSDDIIAELSTELALLANCSTMLPQLFFVNKSYVKSRAGCSTIVPQY
jgi:hypothetical protein